MTTIIFDTLQYSKRAQEAGFTKEQAEFQAEEIASFVETKLATKDDLEKSIEILAYKLTVRFGSMLFAAVGILIAVLKIWH